VRRRKGAALVEVLVWAVISSTVIMGGLAISTLAVRLVQVSQEQRACVVALSSVMNRIGADVLSYDIASGAKWGVELIPTYDIQPIPAVCVMVSGNIRKSPLYISWTQLEMCDKE
jgi:hypothetical protein